VNLEETPCIGGLCTLCIPNTNENKKTPSGGCDGDAMVKPLSTPTAAPASIRPTIGEFLMCTGSVEDNRSDGECLCTLYTDVACRRCHGFCVYDVLCVHCE
jgi:hypothetical protein